MTRLFHDYPATAAICAVLALSACAGDPPPRYHSLLPPPAAPAAPSRAAGYGLEIMPVTLPVYADQPQIMLRDADGLTPLYGERWASPLVDEIQGALSYELVSRLGAPDLTQLGAPTGLPTWRIQVDIQRFDMAADAPALLEATWRLRGPADAGLLCRSRVSAAAQDSTLPALVQAQRQSLAQLATTLAESIENGAKRAPASTDGHEIAGCSPLSASPAATARSAR